MSPHRNNLHTFYGISWLQIITHREIHRKITEATG